MPYGVDQRLAAQKIFIIEIDQIQRGLLNHNNTSGQEFKKGIFTSAVTPPLSAETSNCDGYK
jgi:hypothetical protein